MQSTFFYLNDEKLVIRERKNQLEKKPKYFLFNLTSKKYVSSLYEIAPTKYKYDFDGKEYVLTMSDEIEVKEIDRSIL